MFAVNFINLAVVILVLIGWIWLIESCFCVIVFVLLNVIVFVEVNFLIIVFDLIMILWWFEWFIFVIKVIGVDRIKGYGEVIIKIFVKCVGFFEIN